MRLRAALASTALLGLAACLPVPHPFEDDKLDPHAPILTMPDALGVVVEPVQGAADGPALAEAMAQALQQAEVPASTSAGNARSFHLTGTAEPAPGAVLIHWSMRDAAGTEVGSTTERLALPAGAAPMRDAAATLAGFIQDTAPAEHRSTRRLLVRDVAGAPGDGAKSLKRSLSFLLKRNGAVLTEDPKTPDTVAIAGTVEARPVPPDQDHLLIQWHVLKPDGSEAGVITQENNVPRRIVEGQWGDIAMAVADAAAPDLLRVVQTIPEQ